MNTSLLIGIGAVVAVFALIQGYKWWRKSRRSDGSDSSKR